jgi:hypothetical protein
MNELLYGRFARLLLGVPGTVSRELSGLRVVFEVTKSIDSTANAAVIEVFNLSQLSRTLTEEKKVAVILNAGYTGENPLGIGKQVFFGDIVRSSTEKRGADLVTKIEAGDRIKSIGDSTINAAFKAGTPYTALLNECAKLLGVGLGEIQGVSGLQFLRGLSASGKVTDQLDLIASKANANWSIQDGVLQIIKKDSSNKESVVILNSESGLIGSPNKKTDDKNKTTIAFRCLMQPEIRPARRVRISSRFVTGDYKVTKVTHRGDTRSGDWFSEVEAE